MSLFNRNKALVALSLGALAALGACGDDVTVPVAPAAPVVLTISPPSANMNIGESLNFAVQISGGSATSAPTLASCTSSNTAVVTAAVQGSACRATAVAAGNATVTAAASTGQSAAAAITVAAPAAAISGLAVSPSAASVPVGQSVTIVPTVNRANSGVAVTYTYASSTAAVATVTTGGVVTAVAPGIATITVTAAGTGTGTTATTLTTAATITVTALPTGLTALTVSPSSLSLATGGSSRIAASVQQPTGAAAATIAYASSDAAIASVSSTGVVTGVAAGSAVITVTATAAANASFGAATLSQAVAVTVAPPAQLVINSITLPNGDAVAINNINGQIQVNIALNPNGQNISAVQAWVCEQGEAVAACATRSGAPAAQQTYGASGALAGTVSLAINTAEFATPNWTTGADATVLYRNGLKALVVTATTAGSSTPSASNNQSSVNFNNTDGYTINWMLPSTRATDVGGNSWYGGPGATGTGSFTIVPVIYTPSRTINQVTYQAAAAGCGADITDYARPFAGSYGVQARDTLTGAFRCTGANTGLAGHAPSVTASVDNNSAAGPAVTLPGAGANVRIFNAIGVTGGAFYQSLAYRSASTYVPADYQAPVITRLKVRGGGAAGTDSGWVNASYAFFNVPAAGPDSSYRINDGAGVGLFPTAQRNTVFSVCNTPASISATAATTCATPVATGGLTATVNTMTPALGESSNLTNTAYFLVATETDRLGNRATSNAFAYTDPDLGAIAATDVGVTFGVDRTAPTLLAIPNESATPDPLNPALAGVRSGIDSIFTSAANGSTYAATTGDGTTSINAANARFAVRVSDERSGFYSCTIAVTCPATDATLARIGTFQITRRRAPAGLDASNAVVTENLVDTTTATMRTAMNGSLPTASGGVRQFSVNVFGDAARVPTGITAVATQAGYYTFTATATDRAGNSTTLPTRQAMIDVTAPSITSIQSPFSYTGGASAALTVQSTDDAEVMGAELRVRFPNLTGSIAFARVPYIVAAARTGIFQNPFAALTSNRMAYAAGPGQTFGGSVSLPIPFIQDMQIAAGGAVTQPGAGAAVKPDQISARVMDAKALATPTGGATPTTLANSTSAWTDVAIAAAQVTNSTLRKNWGADEIVGAVTNPGAQIGQWTVYNSGTATNPVVEFRARALTSSANQPFNAVYVVVKRQNTTTGVYGDYEYRGTATYAGVVDEGGFRFFRYTASTGASLGALAQGNNVTYAAFGGIDSLRAVGVDASGNGLSTDAAIPGTTTVPRVISGLAVSAVNVFAPTAAPGTLANYTATGGWWTTSNATTPVTSATSISGDTRVIIGQDAALATARIYATITLPAGVAATSGANTTVTCTSNSADIVVVNQGVAVLQSNAASNTVSQAFCDVRGTSAAGLGTVTITAARAAEAPYAAATALNTFITTNIFSGDNAITALGANSVANLNGAGSWSNVAGSTATPSARQATFTIAAPTFAGVNNVNNTSMAYQTAWAATATGVSVSYTVNPLNGGALVTVTCTGGATGAVAAGQAFTITPIGRAVSNTAFSAPRNGTAMAGTCQ